MWPQQASIHLYSTSRPMNTSICKAHPIQSCDLLTAKSPQDFDFAKQGPTPAMEGPRIGAHKDLCYPGSRNRRKRRANTPPTASLRVRNPRSASWTESGAFGARSERNSRVSWRSTHHGPWAPRRKTHMEDMWTVFLTQKESLGGFGKSLQIW